MKWRIERRSEVLAVRYSSIHELTCQLVEFDNQFSIRQWRPMHTPESEDLDDGESKRKKRKLLLKKRNNFPNRSIPRRQLIPKHKIGIRPFFFHISDWLKHNTIQGSVGVEGLWKRNQDSKLIQTQESVGVEGLWKWKRRITWSQSGTLIPQPPF